MVPKWERSSHLLQVHEKYIHRGWNISFASVLRPCRTHTSKKQDTMAGGSKLFGLSTLLLALALFYQSWKPTTLISIEKQQHAEENTTNNTLQGTFCETPTYKVRILSYYPLIIHLQDFITPRERARILKLRYFRSSTSLETH